MLFHAKQNWDRSSYKAILTIKPLYNIYNVPGVYYCDKYEIIVYTQYAYYTILHTVYSLFWIIKYSNCTARNERVFVFDFTTRLITGRELLIYLDTIVDHRVSAMPKRSTYITYYTLLNLICHIIHGARYERRVDSYRII
jgi:hypothetical protein